MDHSFHFFRSFNIHESENKEEEAGNGHKKYHDLIPTFYTENFSDVDAAILLENQSVIKSCFAF